MTEQEVRKLKIIEARLREQELKRKISNVQARSGNVQSYHGMYFSKKSLIKKGYLDYYKR